MTHQQHLEAVQQVHEAIGQMLEDDEFVMAWTLTVDVAGDDDIRYLAHRAGGGPDGLDAPTAWQAMGMLRASMQLAEDQIREYTEDPEQDDD